MPTENMTLPFNRGEVYFPDDNINSAENKNLEGAEVTVRDDWYNTGMEIVLRVVRNAASFDLYPGYRAAFTDALMKTVNGYCTDPTQKGGVIDELISSNQAIKPNQLFFLVVKGPALMKTGIAGDSGNNFSVGAWLQGCTGGNSSSTVTAGRAVIWDYTGNTMNATALSRIDAMIGKALTARTTANSDTATLVNLIRW